MRNGMTLNLDHGCWRQSRFEQCEAADATTERRRRSGKPIRSACCSLSWLRSITRHDDASLRLLPVGWRLREQIDSHRRPCCQKKVSWWFNKMRFVINSDEIIFSDFREVVSFKKLHPLFCITIGITTFKSHFIQLFKVCFHQLRYWFYKT